MSAFSQRLSFYTKRFSAQGGSIRSLASLADVDRPTVHKMISGERKCPNEQIAKALAHALRLSPQERLDLLQGYQITSMGEETYQRRLAVQSMFTGISQISTSFAESHLPVVEHMEPLGNTYEGQTNVRSMLKHILDLESAQPSGTVRMMHQADDAFLMELLQVATARFPHLTLEHIVCFEQGTQAEFENIQILSRLLPASLSCDNYSVYYYYDQVRGVFSQFAAYPILIYTTQYAVQISADWSSAICTQESDIRALFVKHYASCRALAQPLFSQVNDTFNLLKLYMDFYAETGIYAATNGQGSKNYCHILIPEFCIAPLITTELCAQYLAPELLQKQEFVQFLNNFRETVIRMLDTEKAKHYCTRESLLRFLETGRLTELPSDAYAPFSLQTRKDLLEKCIKSMKSNQYHAQIYDLKSLPLPQNVGICADEASQHFYMICQHQTRGLVCLLLYEPTLTSAILDYIMSLANSPHVLSEEETIAVFQELLDSLDN